MTAMTYLVVLTDDDGDVLATVPDLPNVIATGSTAEDATARARDAIASYIEELERSGIPVPVPSARPVMVDAA